MGDYINNDQLVEDYKLLDYFSGTIYYWRTVGSGARDRSMREWEKFQPKVMRTFI